MPQLYPHHLTDDTVCVVRESSSKFAVYQLRDNKVGTDHHAVKDVERLRTFCERGDIPYLDKPSRMMGEFDDGGEDHNTPETPFYVTLRVYSSTQDGAQSFANTVACKLNGTAHYQIAVGCDWPKYPDLIAIHIFAIRFVDEPDWDAMPNCRFHLAWQRITSPNN
jgi:hypothetical protein